MYVILINVFVHIQPNCGKVCWNKSHIVCDHKARRVYCELLIPAISTCASSVHSLIGVWTKTKNPGWSTVPLLINVDETATVVKVYGHNAWKDHFQTSFRLNSQWTLSTSYCIDVTPLPKIRKCPSVKSEHILVLSIEYYFLKDQKKNPFWEYNVLKWFLSEISLFNYIVTSSDGFSPKTRKNVNKTGQ